MFIYLERRASFFKPLYHRKIWVFSRLDDAVSFYTLLLKTRIISSVKFSITLVKSANFEILLMAAAETFALIKGSLSLIPPTIKIVKELQEDDKDPSMTCLVNTFAEDTLDAVKDLHKSIDQMERSIIAVGFDPKKTVRENDKAAGWNLEKNFVISSASRKIGKIQDNLRSSVSDVGKVLMCKGKFEKLKDFEDFVASVNRDLDGIGDRPIGEILGIYRQWLTKYQKELAG